ncbi:MAG TPA: AtpZ/AtpI family protein [Bryobacteraceae bacterium]|nr:AtpZ/AtpI family protein [Bryobacteraceae bacterium]
MPETPEQRMIHDVGQKQERMLRARAEKRGNWRVISIVGVVGWSVVVPTLAGVAVGAWIDHRWPSRFSWAVILLVAGLVLGCASAWRRIRED